MECGPRGRIHSICELILKKKKKNHNFADIAFLNQDLFQYTTILMHIARA